MHENANDTGMYTLESSGERAARESLGAGAFASRRPARRLRADERALLNIKPRSDASGAWEWLEDNRFLIEREALCAAACFSRRGTLPAGRDDALVCELAYSLARVRAGRVDAASALAFFTGAQRVAPLSLRELEVLGAALTAGLIKLLRTEFDSGEPDVNTVSAAIESLRALSTADLGELTDSLDLAGLTLAREGCGVYPLMDESTRSLYRRRLALLAKRAGMSETECAARVLALAGEHAEDEKRGHVGWWLLVEPLGKKRRERSGALCAALTLLLAAGVSAAAGLISGGALCAALAFIPALEIAKNALDALVLRALPAREIPRMALDGGVPDEGRTVCAVSAVLAKPADGKALARRLETFAAASRDCGKNLVFALLCDLPEGASEKCEADEAVLSAAARAADELNARRGGGFCLFVRPRYYNERDRVWTARERKRGALMSLARYCAGGESELVCLAGDAGAARGAKYILALDADTTLLPGSARELIGAMLHPLVRAEVDEERRVVRAGRGVIHPRVSVELAASERTRFSRVSAGPGGTDPYGSVSGELWMDLTGRGGFAGKGIIDVRALLECCSGLPENLVLSHDAVEGALLRGAYMGSTELTDGCPATPASFLKRQHRWIRGDWQNLAVLARLWKRIPAADRLHLMDSVRRSLTAPAAFAALTAAALAPSAALLPAAVLALLALCAGLPGAVLRALFRPSGRERHPAGALHGAVLGLARALLRFSYLPWEAWTNVSAACTALWRALVSHRKLLQWQTSAQSLPGGALSAWAQIISGAALAVLSPSAAGKTLGVVWLAALLMIRPLGADTSAAPALARESRRFLLDECGRIWNYFADFCTSGRGYLPPDNFQEQPPAGVAERTSPTNIGLAMASCLAAVDLKLASPDEAFPLLEGMLATCERLEKWRGHLYNWYDTRTQLPMEPRYVSTVDSGNLAAGLTAVAAGLREYGRDGLAVRVTALRDGMDFAALYDERRRLFRTGFNVSEGKYDKGCYDLLASESRLTSYQAVARGAVPVRHWRRLSRAMLGRDGYRGLASWTGTMFEYLMPELFLPLQRGSLLWESARFCLYAQRRDVPEGAPWGQSESAYFALDAALGYRYKAHGCAALALRRGMGEDTVCAPYAAYLALAVAPNAAVRNLKRFAALDPGGRWGLWEAVDFTPRRCAGERGEVVRSVMAHHLGMSLISAANCLARGAFTRRFMSEPEMTAFLPLLAERVPEGAVTLSRRHIERPERPGRRDMAAASDAMRCERTSAPRVYPLSNGVHSLLVSSNGLSRSHAGGVELYRGAASPVSGPAGVRICLGGEDLLPVPGSSGEFTLRLGGGLLRFDCRRDGYAASVVCGVSARDTAELRAVEIRAAKPLEAELSLAFEPVLAKSADYASHPAYWRLGLCAEERDGALLIRRTAREGLAECWLCLASDGFLSLRANIDGEPFGCLSHPYVTARRTLRLAAGEAVSARFALSFGADADSALESARRMLASGPERMGDLASAIAAVYGLDRAALALVPELAGRLVFPRCESPDAPAVDALWAAGVSGDRPIIASRETDPGRVRTLCALHSLLRLCGVKSDLVFLTDDGAEYHRPGLENVRRALASLGLDVLLGGRDGVHAAAKAHAPALERAAAVMTDGRALSPGRFPGFAAAAPLPGLRRGGEVEHERRDGEFIFTVRGRLPRRAWCLPMANEGFGCIAADCGSGNMWAKNARTGRINSWLCDERADSGPETLEAVTDGGAVSLFAAEDGLECRVRFGLGFAVWEKLGARVTAFVPLDTAARVLIIENPPGKIRWHTSLQLAAEERDGYYTVTRLENGLLRAENPRSGMKFAAAFSVSAAGWTCSEGAWSSGTLGGECGAGLLPCFGVELPARERLVIACGVCEPAVLARLTRFENAVIELERVKARYTRLCRRNIRTGIAALDEYLDGWAVYQTLVCRLLARSSLYQSGGAFGFRDQLQDAVNLLRVDPGLARGRILDACAHQYAAGDVMHWWHPGEPDMGVRTRISDDLLWLPWAVCEYMDATGDAALLAERVRGIDSPPLNADERSRFERAEPSGAEITVLEHAAQAIQCVLRRGFGPHGLLKMGSGDWCDGFDAVEGESVWLTEFFAHVAARFAKLLDTPSAAVLTSAARRCLRGCEKAWDGRWYRRGYYADGRPLGSSESAGCKIDAVAQAWAVFAGCSAERCDVSLTSALELLHDESGLTRLFTPPFGDGTERAGYINGYGPGFRENGGQYTHAAVWLALALLERGRRAEAEAMLEGIMRRGRDYGAEPFVAAADVYSAPGRCGEAGWSWYTGSAGWLLRAGELLSEEKAEKFTKN